MICSACGGPYHESTGHIHTDKTVLCGPCTREMKTWMKGMMSRKSGGVRFYDHVYTSSNKEVDAVTDEAVQQEGDDPNEVD